MSSTYTSHHLQVELLKLLKDGPKSKTELRDLLGVNEDRIFGELQVLRKRGTVHAVGKRLIARKWALCVRAPAAAKSDAPRRGKFPRPLEERYADLFQEIDHGRK